MSTIYEYIRLSVIVIERSKIYFDCLLSGYKEIIEKRVIGFTWCLDKLFLPPDPYGRDGPSLDEILHKTKAAPTESVSANIDEEKAVE